MPRRLGRQFGVRKQRAYDWEGVTVTSLGLVAGAVTDAVLFLGDRAETIQRVRGEVLASLDLSGSAAGDACIVGVGLIVIPRTGTAGVDPISEPGANWLWHRYIPLATQQPVGTAGNHPGAGFARVEIDNKSMRRLREDESVIFVVANQDAVGAPIVDVIAGVRLLTGH